jgi:hypothetical protein
MRRFGMVESNPDLLEDLQDAYAEVSEAYGSFANMSVVFFIKAAQKGKTKGVIKALKNALEHLLDRYNEDPEFAKGEMEESIEVLDMIYKGDGSAIKSLMKKMEKETRYMTRGY